MAIFQYFLFLLIYRILFGRIVPGFLPSVISVRLVWWPISDRSVVCVPELLFGMTNESVDKL